MPGKPAEVVTQKKKVAKAVRGSKVPTEPVRQGIVASVSRRRKTLTNVVTLEANSSGEVVSDSNVLTEPVKQSVAIVSRKRKAKPLTEDYGGSIAKVKTQKRQGVVQTDDVISNVKPASASKKIKKPTLVPSAVIPSISDYDDDSLSIIRRGRECIQAAISS